MRRLLTTSSRLLSRRLSTMTPRSPPSHPLVVIFGSTGTGKSDLAVELATRFRGEIINADAMQMYRGLPILTNKISEPERRGIPHHLLDKIGLEEETWVVDDFVQEALALIREIRSRDRLPIVVGGTHYYLNALLFDDTLGDRDATSDPLDGADVADGATPSPHFPILDEPTEVIAKKLREVDPVMADRWHPNDRRKITRSLEIFLRTGRRASDLYAEQRAQKKQTTTATNSPPPDPSPRNPDANQPLLFWLHSAPEILQPRLDVRVDKMLKAGLLDEVGTLHSFILSRRAAGQDTDMSRGIWQSIGYKQFEPYVEHTHTNSDPNSTESEKIKAKSLEEVKVATRQYARYQTRWITRKMLPVIQESPDSLPLYVLDSSDISSWDSNVADAAVSITKTFLEGNTMPDPRTLSDAARAVLDESQSKASARYTPGRHVCDICNTTVVYEEFWQRHLKSSRHARLVRMKKRRALVVVDKPAGDESDKTKPEDEEVDSLDAGPIEFPT